MADEGAKVVCVDVKPDYANGCAEAIKTRGGEAIGVVCDVTHEAQAQAAVARAREAFGGVEILVNGAVIFNRKGVLDMPLEEWSRQIAVILSGSFLFTKHVARLLWRFHGVVVLLSAVRPSVPNGLNFRMDPLWA